MKGQVHTMAWLGDTLELFSPFENPKNFLNMVEIIFGMHKDPRIKEIKACSKGGRIQNLLINKQIETIDDRKTKNTHDFDHLVYGYTTLELGQDPGLCESREKMILPEQKPWMDKKSF